MHSLPRPFGLLNVNKPADVTSRSVVSRVHRLVRPARCGHAGTLDPMATGVLLLLLGPATRLVPLLHTLPKTYVARFRLGATSDTDDATGAITETAAVESLPGEPRIRAALQQQVGTIRQVPPRFSAVHVGGQRAYRLARSGVTPELKPKSVVVHEISVRSWQPPELELEIQCGSGTYIRSIARDLGTELGCGALMSALVRTAVGRWRLVDAVDPDDVSSESLPQQLIPAAHVVRHLPQYRCSREQTRAVACGRFLRSVSPEDVKRPEPEHSGSHAATAERPEPIALLSQDGSELLALAEERDEATGLILQPRSVFVTSDSVL